MDFENRIHASIEELDGDYTRIRSEIGER